MLFPLESRQREREIFKQVASIAYVRSKSKDRVAFLALKKKKKQKQCVSIIGEDPLEKEMATNSTILAWEIPWTEEPGELQSMELQRVSHNLVTKKQKSILDILKNPGLNCE